MSFIVGIGGGTASGKSTVAAALAAHLGESAVLIAQDRYYHSLPGPPLGFDFDHPSAVALDALATDLQALARGQAATLPVYDFANHRRTNETERVEAKPVVIAEGLHVLGALIRPHLHCAVYVQAPDDLRLIRRIRRDVKQRGRTVDSVLDQYERTVRPAHEQFVAPCADTADLLLDGLAPIEACVRLLLERFPVARN